MLLLFNTLTRIAPEHKKLCWCRGFEAVEQMTRDAETSGLDQQAISQLQTAYASFLITFATKCWMMHMAAPRILHEKLSQPGQDIWQYLRNHINDVPAAFGHAWQLDQTQLHAHLISLAAVELKGIFCTMLDTREPWSILYDR